jgi:hypothetical protein
MAPPAGRPAQPDQARCLSRHAVRCHQLLLLADRTDEAERMHTEAGDSYEDHRQQGRHDAQGEARPLTRIR